MYLGALLGFTIVQLDIENSPTSLGFSDTIHCKSRQCNAKHQINTKKDPSFDAKNVSIMRFFFFGVSNVLKHVLLQVLYKMFVCRCLKHIFHASLFWLHSNHRLAYTIKHVLCILDCIFFTDNVMCTITFQSSVSPPNK